MVNYQKKYKVKIKWKLVQSAESKDEKEREIYIEIALWTFYNFNVVYFGGGIYVRH